MIAERVIKLLAIKGKVDIAALDGIRLSSGEGYIELAGGDVNIQAPGKISFKGSQYSFEGRAVNPIFCRCSDRRIRRSTF